MAIIVSICLTVTIFLLYQTAFKEQQSQLLVAVKSQKELIEAVGRFDQKNSQKDHKGGALGGTLSQVIDAHSHYQSGGKTSSFILIEETHPNNPILLHTVNDVLVTDRHELNGKAFNNPIWVDNILNEVFTKRQGILVNDEIIAVFEEVKISTHKFLLVSKVDLIEVRAPFIRATLVTLVLALLLIFIGAITFAGQINPIIRRIENQNAYTNALLETTVNPIITINHLGYIQSFNNAASTLFGYKSDEVINKNVKILMPSSVAEKHDDILKSYFQTGEKKVIGQSTEVQGKRKDGTTFPMQLSVGEMEIDEKSMYVGIIMDLTERKQEEGLLIDTLARAAAIIDTVPDGVFTIDEQGIVQSMNPAAEKIFGYFVGEVEGKNINMLMPEPLHSSHDNYLERYVNSNESRTIGITQEVPAKHKSGIVFPIELTVNEFYLSSSRYFTGVVRDITERKAAELELKNHRDNLQKLVAVATTEINAIVQTAVNSVVTIDQDGLVHIFNPAAEKMFGWESNEIIGKNVAIIIPGIDSTTHNTFIKRYLDTHEAHIIGIGREVQALRKDGSTFPAHLAVGHCELTDDTQLFVAFIADISKQKQAEKELQAAKERAEQAARTKANFLANMSHEIRTPMNAIIGFSEVTLQDSSLSKDTKQHISTILSSGKNLLAIINDILDFSKIEAGKILLESITFNLPNVVKDSLRTLEFKAAEKDLELTLNISKNTPVRVNGDPSRLRQVILNLAGNAIKFTTSGQVSIHLEKHENDLLHFSVKDTGIGMSEEQLKKVFDAFSQADASTNRRFGGTGLGTTISKQIVELMGGKIWAESAQGKGSTFHFTAQLSEATSYENCLYDGDHYIESEYNSPRLFKVLLAEDLPVNAKLATLRLEQQGHTVTWVENGKLAVEEMQKGEFDVVLMDVQMPELDGISATRAIRQLANASVAQTPIIALTASVMKEDQQECFDAGMNAITGKPINFSELFSIMETSVNPGKGKLKQNTTATQSKQETTIDLSSISHYVNVEKGLRTWLDPHIFAESLLNFVEEHQSSPNKLKELLSSSPIQIQEAKAISHNLKGLSGNLALEEVCQIITQIDNCLLNSQPTPALEQCDALIQSMNQASKAIHTLSLPQQHAETSQQKQLSPQELSTLLSSLIQAFSELNPENAEPYMEQLSQTLAPDDLRSIRNNVNAFDFDAATEAVIRLSEHLNIPLSEETLL